MGSMQRRVAESLFWDLQEYEDGDSIMCARGPDGAYENAYEWVAVADGFTVTLTVENAYGLLAEYIRDSNVDDRDRVLAQALVLSAGGGSGAYEGWYADLARELHGGFEGNFCHWAAVHHGTEVAS